MRQIKDHGFSKIQVINKLFNSLRLASLHLSVGPDFQKIGAGIHELEWESIDIASLSEIPSSQLVNFQLSKTPAPSKESRRFADDS